MAKIVMYATAVCPYCVRAEALLKRKGQTDIDKRYVDRDPALRQEMETRVPGARTVPQIFINDHHVGGCDDLHELEHDGKLDALLAG
jgi:glutaredoxin 3